MAQSQNSQFITYPLILILLIAAASGWYLYNVENNKNEATSVESEAQLQDTRSQLTDLQTKFDRLGEERNALDEQLQQTTDDQSDQISKLQKSSDEQLEQIKKLHRNLADSQFESKSFEERTNSLTDELNRAKSNIITTNRRYQKRIDELTEENQQLDKQLGQEMATGRNLLIELDRINTEKATIENRLKENIDSAKFTTAELEEELEKRRDEQASLENMVESVSNEKTVLLTQLEREQQRKQEIANLKNRLEQELNETRVEISQLKNQMTVIKLTNEVLFDSGSAGIKPKGKKVLSIIADSLNQYPDRAISVEGHTDNVPISNASYPSNWALSVARSMAAVNFFQQQKQVSPGRLQIVGFGEYRPMANNDTTAGRELNRRIEIKLLPPVLTQ